MGEEAAKYGNFKKCVIKEIKGAPDSKAIRIFLQYEKVDAAAKCYADMNGRYFGGRVVQARFYDEQRFSAGDLLQGAPSRIVLLTNLVGKGEVDEDLEAETA